MADYDAGEITDRERKAAENQTALSKQNVRDVQNQLKRQLANYDFADAQNRALANAQLKQNSRKTSADRFEAQRDLQAATLGLLGSMGSAMNGSSTGNLLRMLESRNDKENNTYWAQLQENQDQVENAYNDSLNQNNVARRDAMQSAEKAIRDIESDWAANLNNINPNLFQQGAVGGNGALSSVNAWNANNAKQNNARMSGYVIPDNRGNGTRLLPTGEKLPNYSMHIGGSRNAVRGNANNEVSGDYFSQLMNRFNRDEQRMRKYPAGSIRNDYTPPDSRNNNIQRP